MYSIFCSQTKDRVLRVWDIVSEEDIMSLSFSDAGFCKISTFHSSKFNLLYITLLVNLKPFVSF